VRENGEPNLRPRFASSIVIAKPRESPKLRGLNSSRGGKAELFIGAASASFASGPSGCILSAVLVARDIAISIVLKAEGRGGPGARKRDRVMVLVKGVGLRDWKWRWHETEALSLFRQSSLK
jgi:hypothetical protein